MALSYVTTSSAGVLISSGYSERALHLPEPEGGAGSSGCTARASSSGSSSANHQAPHLRAAQTPGAGDCSAGWGAWPGCPVLKHSPVLSTNVTAQGGRWPGAAVLGQGDGTPLCEAPRTKAPAAGTAVCQGPGPLPLGSASPGPHSSALPPALLSSSPLEGPCSW